MEPIASPKHQVPSFISRWNIIIFGYCLSISAQNRKSKTQNGNAFQSAKQPNSLINIIHSCVEHFVWEEAPIDGKICSCKFVIY